MRTVSVIIPVFNTDEFIEHCLMSVIEQTYEWLDIILINDNSNDECTAFLETLVKRDERIRLYHNDSQKGVGYSRNFGLKKAIGKYVYFIDSDDYIAPQTIQILVEHIGHCEIISGRKRRVHLDQSKVNEEDIIINHFTESKFDKLNNGTVLNRLFKRDYIEKHSLQFSEDIIRYSDLTFMIPAFLNTDVVAYVDKATYFKRSRLSSAKTRSLMQVPMGERITDFRTMFNKIKYEYKQFDTVIVYMDMLFLRIYRRQIVAHFRMNRNVDAIFSDLVEMAKETNEVALTLVPFLIRREIKTLRKGNIEKFKRMNLWHHRFRKLRNAVKTKRRLYIQLYRTIFLRLPIEKKTVLFESFLGKSYSDNPKYIYEHMRKHKKDYKFVWSVAEEKDIPGNPIQVKRFSLRYFYYMAISQYWISNARLPLFLHKRDETIYLQTWHGTPLKKLANDMDEVHMPGTNTVKYKRNFIREASRWDYLISPNTYSTGIFRRAFQFDQKMLEYGYPRNDILYDKNDEKSINMLKSQFNLPTDKKVILYAPTWRDDEFYEKGKYKFQLQLNLDRLQSQLGDDYIIILRMHYLIASVLDISEYENFVYDFSSYNDIAELYLISDILITDYSSVFFDYANLKRPILFYTYDLEKYRDTLRGFYIDIEKDVPGPLLETTDEIIEAIINIDEVQANYARRYEQFYKRFCHLDDGTASQKTVDKLLSTSIGDNYEKSSEVNRYQGI